MCGKCCGSVSGCSQIWVGVHVSCVMFFQVFCVRCSNLFNVKWCSSVCCSGVKLVSYSVGGLSVDQCQVILGQVDRHHDLFSGMSQIVFS
ncbi:hypothetical protein TNCT_171371, partial [Trichonephila clavata]